MVIIRLSRFGRKKAPYYRIVAVDSGKKTTGKYLETIGTWNPAKKELKFDKAKIGAWVKKGASLSATVKKLTET
jgi:small subunit ribosomal protein S16